MYLRTKLTVTFATVAALIMVVLGVLYYLNSKKDDLVRHNFALYRTNLALITQIIDLEYVEYTLQRIVLPPPEYPRDERKFAVNIRISLKKTRDWANAFPFSEDYQTLDDYSKEKFKELSEKLVYMDSNTEEILNEKSTIERNIIYRKMHFPVLEQTRHILFDIASRNSLIYAVKKGSVDAYADKIFRMQFLFAIAGFVAIIIVFLYAGYLLRPLKMINEGLRRIIRGDFTYHIPKVSNDELGMLSDQFNIMITEIKQNRDRLEDKVMKRTIQLLESKEEVEKINDNLSKINHALEEYRITSENDMLAAINIQSNYFYKKPPDVNGWDVAFWFQPMSGISGDMYDFYVEGDALKGVSLFDVSGHGIASGLVTMLAKQIVEKNFIESPELPLNVILSNINTVITKEVEKISTYLTGVMLRFNGDRIEYVNAGHPEIILKKSGGTTEPVDSRKKGKKDHFIGYSIFSGAYNQTDFNVNTNDTLLLYSDGICDLLDFTGERFGRTRLIEAVNFSPEKFAASEQLGLLRERVSKFMGTVPQNDDITVILLKKV